MCDDCSCTALSTALSRAPDNHARTEAVDVVAGILAENDRIAAHNRAHFSAAGVLAVNLMSAPGSGKTLLLEKTIDALGREFRIGVIEGDLETENDAARIRARGAPAVQITTGGACHLDARMVHAALDELDLAAIDLLFIENVGNLVCPASFDLGQTRNVALLSVTEGDDKPAKYPVLFRACDLVLLTKTDLAPCMDDFDVGRAERNIRNLANDAPIYALSAKTGANFAQWCDWLRRSAHEQSRRLPTSVADLRKPVRLDAFSSAVAR